MEVVERKPVPIYEAICPECGSKIHYKTSEVFNLHIDCPICGMSMWAYMLKPVKMEG